MNENIKKHWEGRSDDSYRVMNVLYDNKEYMNALFFGHLTLEKLLKALYVKTHKDVHVPPIHNLVKLAMKCNLELDELSRNQLGLINTFCIEAWYDDIKREFYKKCTYEFTTEQIIIIRRLREWIKKELTQNC